jgi:hypothetical protein
MNSNEIAKMIDRRVKNGNNRDESISLLNEIIAQFTRIDNLTSALVYNGFITVHTANKMALAA